ncbi:LysR family transcriptional regulator [Slackia piriformis]
MRVNQLQYFESVARNLSFTKAAEECHVAQPAISQQIHALEQELGFALLVRSTKGVGLTETRRTYHHEVAGVLDALDRAARRARAIADGKAGTLSVGIANSGQTTILGVLKEFAAKYPAVTIELRRTHAIDQYLQLLQGVFDVMVTATGYMAKMRTCAWWAATQRLCASPCRKLIRSLRERRCRWTICEAIPISSQATKAMTCC